MKKVLSILLVLTIALSLALSLAACSKSGEDGNESQNTNSPESSAPPSSSTETSGSESVAPPAAVGKPYPNANADGTINLDTIAHYDAEYDYTQNERIKAAYLVQENSPLYQQAAEAYEHWSSLYNMEWAGFISSNGDADMFLTNLQNLIDQGVRALIIDPDTTIIPAANEILEKYEDVAWMTHAAPPRDGNSGSGIPMGGNLVHPSVGFNHYDAGHQVTKKLVEWKEETFPDVPWEDVGFICMAYSIAPPLQERVVASQELWLETTGNLDNFFVADTVSSGLNLQGGIDAVGPVITTNTDYKYWLVNGLIDDLAQAAAIVIDQQGLTDNSCVITFGGSALQMQWDMGTFDSFRYALFTANNLYAEPIIGAVYAYLQGWATPDTIWPSWVKWDDHGADAHTYSQLRLPTTWLEQNSYKHYLEWTDMYANASAYNYPQDGILPNDFSPFVDEVPADYAAP